MESLGNLQVLALSVVTQYGPKLIGAILTLIVGLVVIKLINKAVAHLLGKHNWDPSLAGFVKSILSVMLKVLLIVSVIGMVGVEMTSFIAIIGAAGLAVGMALSGTLQNFAGGVMILMFKPFKVGDFIEAQGYLGKVAEIQIFNTILKTPDNKTVIVPNGSLSNSSMTNYSTEPTRRVDFTFGIAYGDSVDKAREIIAGLLQADKRVLDDPKPMIVLSELADSSVNLAVKVWVQSADYWDVFFSLNENVYNTFAKEGINIPFPQMDVHVNSMK